MLEISVYLVFSIMIPSPKFLYLNFFTIVTVFFGTINTLIGVIGTTATRCNKIVQDSRNRCFTYFLYY